MFRIRFHGRGGQGMKTASRMLGTAFFLEGYEVQDAPRYGAERRGAPIFAYVRADTAPINERGVIPDPDLVLVADDTLAGVAAAGVLQGIDAHTVLVLNTLEGEGVWRDRLAIDARIVSLPAIAAEDPAQRPYVGAILAGAAARLLGLRRDSLCDAIATELEDLGADIIAANTEQAGSAYDSLAENEGIVYAATNGEEAPPPDWIVLTREDADRSAPTIHAGATSVRIKTGLWRTLRPVIDKDLCKRCIWVCGSFCPDGVIDMGDDGYPVIDYDHCKGCLICLAQCPPHAIQAIAEKGEAP